MNQLPILIKREFWEHRGTFIVLPAVTAGFFMALMLLVFTASSTEAVTVDLDWEEHESHESFDGQIETDDVVGYALQRLQSIDPMQRINYFRAGLFGMTSPMFLILWFVIIFYLLSCLYEDRRDRSILFWKSLPVSDAMTVFSKLVTGMLVVPSIYLIAIVAIHCVGLLLLSFGTIGTDIPIWETIWQPASVMTTWLQLAALILFYSLWALPFYAWLMAVSAYAKSVPLVWAIGVPVAISILEWMFTDKSVVGPWIKNHMAPVGILQEDRPLLEVVEHNFFSLEMVSAIVVGCALLGLVIWLRGKADEL